MKSIYVVRHAKSSWGDFTLPDFDRPLNERGKKDAPDMARRLLKKGIKFDAFVSSPAKRAQKTAAIFCEEYAVKKDAIILIDQLYHAAASTIYDVIAGLDDDYKTVALFSHNPGITDFVNNLVPDVRIDNMPTCGIFAVQAPVKSWSEFAAAEKKFISFDYPKAL